MYKKIICIFALSTISMFGLDHNSQNNNAHLNQHQSSASDTNSEMQKLLYLSKIPGEIARYTKSFLALSGVLAIITFYRKNIGAHLTNFFELGHEDDEKILKKIYALKKKIAGLEKKIDKLDISRDITLLSENLTRVTNELRDTAMQTDQALLEFIRRYDAEYEELTVLVKSMH